MPTSISTRTKPEIPVKPEPSPMPQVVKPEPQELKNRPLPPVKPTVKLKRRGSKKWRTPVILTAIAVTAGGGWWAWSATHPTGNGIAGLITDTVKRGDITETVSATGSISSQTGTQVKIGSQITGRIKKLNADVGSHVKAGQIIAELDLPDIEAQLHQAQANLWAGKIKVAQFQSGVGMLQTQLNSAIVQGRAGTNSATAKLNVAQAGANQQFAQTPTDIQRGINGVASAKAALATAQSNLVQIQTGVALQVANAQQQINQAEATARNSTLNLHRQQQLLQAGFVAASIVDQALATGTVNQSLILAAQQNLVLVQQKNTADLQSGRNLITQAAQNVKIAQATLTAARAETFLNAAKLADVGDARAALGQANATLITAQGNLAQNTLRQQDIVQAQNAVRAQQEQVAYAQAQVDKTFIRSPITGTVLQLASQQGETLAAGLASPTLIVVADLNRLQVDAYVDETQIGKVKLGQSVIFTVDALATQQFTGHVTKIASGSTIQQSVITYDVTIKLDKQNRQFKPDMTANMTIETGKETNVLLVPSDAVKIGTGGMTVNVLVKKGTTYSMVMRKVTTGGTDGTNTQILKGLTEGETIVLAGTLKVAAAKKSTSLFPTGGGGGRGGGGGGRGGGGGGR